METIQLKDFLDFSFLSNLQLSEQGNIVFCETKCNEEENTYEQRLCMIKDNVCTYLTNGKKESQYSICEEDVIFTSLRDKKDVNAVANNEELTCFYRISLHGGESVKLFSVPYKVSRFEKVDADHFIMLVQYDEKYAKMSQENRVQTLKENEDYEEFTSIPFYFNGSGYSKDVIGRLYVYEISTNTMLPISQTNVDVGQFSIAKDQQVVYYVASNVQPRPSLKEGVYAYNLSTQKSTTLVSEKEYSVACIEAYQDGVMMIANKEIVRSNNDNPNFYIVNQEGITLLNQDGITIGNSVGSDCRFGGGRSIQVVDSKLYFLSTEEEKAVLKCINEKGVISTILAIEGSIDGFVISDGIIYYVALKDNQLQEIYCFKNKENVQLTHMNKKLENKYVANYEAITFENDGYQFKGWVLLPENYDPNKKYPAILDIHGGPKTVYGKVYYHEMQVWANMGYIVFFTNPRGSDGFGDDFSDIYGKYGSIDYDDLMKFTDIVIKTYAIDEKRIGVTGGSYGGFMSNWIITHTNRFACAATQRSISNWISFYGTSDIGFHFAEDQIRGNVFDSVEKLWDHSPLKYARNVTTPTLFIHSDEDYRCPLEQGLQLYTALVDQNVEAKFVMFRKENHELSRSGLPKHRVKRLEEITNWMETHLK